MEISPSNVLEKYVNNPIRINVESESFEYTRHKLAEDYGEFVPSASKEELETHKVIDIKSIMINSGFEIPEEDLTREILFKPKREVQNIYDYYISEGFSEERARTETEIYMNSIIGKACGIVENTWGYVSMAAVASVGIVTKEFKQINFMISTEGTSGIESTAEFFEEARDKEIEQLREILLYLGFDPERVEQ